MGKRSLILIAVTTALLAGCGSSVPECGDSEATELVEQIATQETEKRLGKRIADAITYSVGAVRTTYTNDQTGSYECAAELGMEGNGSETSFPITYTVEMTDDGEQFYVNVFGL